MERNVRCRTLSESSQDGAAQLTHSQRSGPTWQAWGFQGPFAHEEAGILRCGQSHAKYQIGGDDLPNHVGWRVLESEVAQADSS